MTPTQALRILEHELRMNEGFGDDEAAREEAIEVLWNLVLLGEGR